MQEYIGKIKMNYDFYPGEDSYSDGPIEDELLELVKNNPPEEFDSIIAKKDSWPILYHLSKIRANILETIDFKGDERVLEIGAGCGAITGALAKKAGSVTCVDLSKRRSLINAYRNIDRDNIEIIVGNFETVEKNLTEKYDLITLIGVFEYGQYYISTDRPYEDFLDMVKRHLAPNGRIAIAIENKFGMKYWAGCREDHVGKLFAGIEDYAGIDKVRTFSKKELSELLSGTGFKNQSFYYPYPDYKLPTCIFSDEYLPKPGMLNNNLRNFDNDRLLLFDEGRAFDNVIKDGMFPYFSNSFLVLAAFDDSFDNDGHIIYAKASNERGRGFNVVTKLERSAGGELCGVKYPADAASSKHIDRLLESCGRLAKKYEGKPYKIAMSKRHGEGACTEFVLGESYEVYLDKLLSQGDFDGFAASVRSYFDTVFFDAKPFVPSDEFKNVFGNSLDGVDISGMSGVTDVDIDGLFSNVIYDGGWVNYDYEWTMDFMVPVDYVKYRILSLYFTNKMRNEYREKAFNALGISSFNGVYDNMEKHFQSYVNSGAVTLFELYPRIHGVTLDARYAQKRYAEGKSFRAYFDMGDGYTEDNSIPVSVDVDYDGRHTAVIRIPDGAKTLRIDPANAMCTLRILKLRDDKNNGLAAKSNGVKYKDGIIFLHNDPQLIIKDGIEGAKYITIVYELSIMDMDNGELRVLTEEYMVKRVMSIGNISARAKRAGGRLIRKIRR